MEWGAPSVIGLVDVQLESLVKIIKRDGLIALRRNVQAIQAMFIFHNEVAAFLDKHLANLYITVEGGVVDGRKLFVEGLPIGPAHDDVIVASILA